MVVLLINSFIPVDPNSFYFQVLSFSVTSISAALLLSKADSIKKFKHPVFGKTIMFISVISYSMYLVNLAIVAQVIDTNFPPQTLWENAYMYVVYWIATIVIATILYTFHEKPVTDLRNK
ncbi:MAG: peptidoglycan/LPS O-acetylase OafA/YrhL [Salibacteraceae bacterium]